MLQAATSQHCISKISTLALMRFITVLLLEKSNLRSWLFCTETAELSQDEVAAQMVSFTEPNALTGHFYRCTLRSAHIDGTQ